MKIIVAVLMGACSGFLIHAMTRMPFSFALGWVVSAFLLQYQAATISKVLERGFLLGAIEWLLIIVVGMVRATQPDEVLLPGVGIRLIVCLFMAVICLTGFAVVQFRQRHINRSSLSQPPL